MSLPRNAQGKFIGVTNTKSEPSAVRGNTVVLEISKNGNPPPVGLDKTLYITDQNF